jgi:hypothetical protein
MRQILISHEDSSKIKKKQTTHIFISPAKMFRPQKQTEIEKFKGFNFIYECPYNINDCSVTSKNKEHKVGVKKYISNEALSRYFLHLG